MDAHQLRHLFTEFFVDRGHASVPSSGLIPHHPTAPMFTNAGMNQFVPYFLGEETPPWKRTMSVQKCVRLSGKHNDIDELGKTRRHLTFFEMLGNWSFGDYFKEQAITMAWELLTEVLGFDGDRLWPTVHTTDDEAEAIWHETVGVPMDRIQRMDKENFWEMGETGPCGPCSEIHFDCGPEWGDAGGPAHGASDRYVEFWNLVFMDRFRNADGSLSPLPAKNVDTGGGLERWLMLLQGVPTVFDTDVIRPLIAKGESLSGKRYGDDARMDTYLRVLADHARSMTFLVNDGVTPSNEDRGYVVRSVIRRAVRRAYQLGVQKPILPEMVEGVIEIMDPSYPELGRNRDTILTVIAREEERFLQTLRSGSVLLDEALDRGEVSGTTAFRLHDTYGFPFELTQEIAAERSVPVDKAGFDTAMSEQRRRARESRKVTLLTAGDEEGYRQLLAAHGPTEFTGYSEYESKGTVLAVVDVPSTEGGSGPAQVEIFLDRTPFYAEQGGQVGDTGVIETSGGSAEVVDTTYALPGLVRHVAVVTDGTISPGEEARAAIDGSRRDAIRRNHTGTHMLHWALREVLGSHVRQHGSYVAPDQLRFDFSHYGPVTPDELRKIEDLANERILADEPVRAYETSKAQAEQLGAIAFFEEKYGEVVRVIEAGSRSMELCGGTHVSALGMIGPIKVISEGSIGANMRRIVAVTGTGTIERTREEEQLLEAAAELLRTKPAELPAAIEREIARRKELEDELKALRSAATRAAAGDLEAAAINGVVVARHDGVAADQLKDLAVTVRDRAGLRAVVLIGSPDGQRVALVAATAKDSDLHAPTIVGEAAKVVGGGGGGKDPTLGTAGGRDASAIDAALDVARARLGVA